MNSITEVCAWLAGWLISVLIGALIGRSRADLAIGVVLAFCLGPIGWLIAALLPDKRLRCFRCGVLLWHAAYRCPACALPLVNKVNSLMLKTEIEQDLQAAADRYAIDRSAEAK
jgi:predicted branched-subunit amino acid permease